MEEKCAAEREKEKCGEADRREVSNSNVFGWMAAQPVVLISRCDRGSMPLVQLQTGWKEKVK